MDHSVERSSRSNPDVIDSATAIWSELKRYLERRSKDLNEEIRNYPTPIARCDEQLTRLIEQRARAVDQLRLMVEAAPTPASLADRDWLPALGKFLTDAGALTDDETERALRARLTAALSRRRGEA